MPTTNVSTIGSTGDYSTLALWEAGTDNNLVTGDVIERGEFQDEAHSVAAEVKIAGATVDATRYRVITKVSGAASPGKTRGVANVISMSHRLRFEENYVQVIDLELDCSGSSAQAIQAFTGTGQTIKNVLCYDGPSSGIRSVLVTSLTLINVAALNFASDDGFSIVSGSTGSALNCTALNNGSQGFSFASNGWALKNCSSFGNTTQAFIAPAGTSTVDNCACDDTSITDDTPGGSGNVESLTYADQITTVTAGSEDFTPKSGAGILDVGQDLTSSGVTTDIAGLTRPQGTAFDIGAAELFVSPVGIAEGDLSSTISLTKTLTSTIQSTDAIPSPISSTISISSPV